MGTKAGKFGAGQIYIFGQGRIQVTLPLPTGGASPQTLQFCADKLVCLDTRHDLSFYSLVTKTLVASHSPPGVPIAVLTDPMLDYALLGMQTGDILAYDMDREHVAPFRIPNLWTEYEPRARVSPIVSLAFHPRDIGTLLIGYTHGAAIYSFKQNKSLRFFQYEVPPGAPGGDSDPASANIVRRPKLTQAVWHPTGTFILTGHEDSSLVFWDPKDGRLILARTISDTHIEKPGRAATTMGSMAGTVSVKEPIFRVAWCANQDPDDTAILIAGGADATQPTKGMTLLELGRTPVYATSSWEVLTAHLESPKRQRILPTPPNAEVVDFCLIPRTTPHFAGAHDPIAVLSLLSSGEVISLSFPSGLPISPTNQLHVSMTFVHPFVRHATLAAVGREQWLSLTESRATGPPILRGGVGAPLPLRRYENRNIVQTAHADGTVRLWDAGHGDQLENGRALQVDVGRAVGRIEGVDITNTSLALGTEGIYFAAGTRSGEVAIFGWGHNRNAGRETTPRRPNSSDSLPDISHRVDPSLKDGFCPLRLLDLQNGPITALKFCEMGFVAAASEGGKIAIIDMQGPTIIFSGTAQDISKGEKQSTIRRLSSTPQNVARSEYVTSLEFSIMALEGEQYSSILLHAGTDQGHIGTFKILPGPRGPNEPHIVTFAGASKIDGRVIHLAPIGADTGRPAFASSNAAKTLGTNFTINGVLLAVSNTEIRIFRPATSKGAHKTFGGNFFCDAAGVARYQDQGHALVCLFGDGNARLYSIPGLKEIAAPQRIGGILDVRRFGDAVITSAGNILGWKGPSEMALLNVWGAGLPLPKSQDGLFNPAALIPPRPTISNFQWVSGTQYITPVEMDILIGGPDRPPSKRMIAQQRSDEQQRRAAARPGSSSSAASAAAATAAGQDNEGYWAYMQRQIQERTEKLNMMGDSMENLEANSSGWADDVSKFVGRQKRNAATGCKFIRLLTSVWRIIANHNRSTEKGTWFLEMGLSCLFWGGNGSTTTLVITTLAMPMILVDTV